MNELSTLTDAEREEYQRHEKVVGEHFKKFFEVGEALMAIRDKRLYREEYATYDEYCSQKWGFKGSRARQLVGGYEVARDIETVTSVTLSNERQARAVNSLSPSVRADAVAGAAAKGPITAESIKDEGKKLEAERTPDQKARDAVYASPYIAIKQKLKLGSLTPQKALLVVDALNGCKPTVRGDMIRMNIVDATVIRMLGERQKSETYKELVKSGHIQFADERTYKAHDITPEVLRAYLSERAREHRTRGHLEKLEKKNVEIVPVNIYRGDPGQTAAVLLRELDIEDITEIVALLEAKLAAMPAA